MKYHVIIRSLVTAARVQHSEFRVMAVVSKPEKRPMSEEKRQSFPHFKVTP